MRLNISRGLVEGIANYTAEIIDYVTAVIDGVDTELSDIDIAVDGAVLRIGIEGIEGHVSEIRAYDSEDAELFGGTVSVDLRPSQATVLAVSFADLEQSQIQYTQQDVIDGQVNVNTVNWSLVAQFDATFFNTIEIEASGISLKIWDYDDHTTAHFDKNFASMEKVVVPVTDAMRGILEFHVKGSGVINSAIAYKGEKV